MMPQRVLLALSLSAFSATALAGTYTVSGSGAPGSSNNPLTISFAGDGSTVDTEVVLSYSNANITITNPVASNGAQCLQPTATTLRIVPPSGGATPLTSTSTLYCTYSVAVAGGAADGTNVAFTTDSIECTNAMANAVMPCTVTAPAQFQIQSTPVQRTLAFAPNFGTTITFAGGGNAGAAAPTQNIVVTSTGNAGTPSVTGCAITGAAAAQFSVNPTSLNGFDTTNPQNLVVGCTYAAAAATATLTCNENDADTAGTARTWTLSCPAGAVVPVNPTITANPASGSTITVSGTIGGTGTSLLDFTATGGAGTGSTTINCTSTGTVLLALAPGTPSGTTANQTVTGAAAAQDVIIGVPLTSTAQTPAGTVTCQVTPNGGGTTTLTYTINANAGVAAVAVVVPANDLWSKIALFGLLAGLGVLVIGFRRQH